jgi:hypothetical protein
MRTTITLDDDVAEQLAWFREERKMSLRDAVNVSLRKGLFVMLAEREKPRKRFKSPVLNASSLLPDETVGTHDMLAYAEGETYR